MDNFRDLGGIVTDNNREIIKNKIFRSDALINLSDEERKYLNNLHIDEVFDLRSNAEQIARPDEPIAVIRSVPALPDIGTVLEPAALEELVMKADDDMLNRLIDKVQSLYEVIAFKNSAYSQVFDSMRQGRTFIFHCTAGKDRTGVLAALILILLGCSEEKAISDYMLSNQYRQKINSRVYALLKSKTGEQRADKIIRFYCVEQVCIEKTLSAIKAKYSDYAEFFLKEYSITDKERAEITELYTRKI